MKTEPIVLQVKIEPADDVTARLLGCAANHDNLGEAKYYCSEALIWLNKALDPYTAPEMGKQWMRSALRNLGELEAKLEQMS